MNSSDMPQDNCDISVATFNRRASQYQDKYMDISLYHDGLDQLIQQLPNTDAKILEFGCGPGNVTQYMMTQNPQLDITGVDLAPKMIELAKLNCPAATFKVMDCRKLASLPQNYDAIVCGFVFPYLSKQEISQLLQDASQKLNDNGLIYISTMSGVDADSGMQTSKTSGDQIYIYSHQQDYLLNQLEKFQFKILFNDTVTADEAADNDLIIIARKS